MDGTIPQTPGKQLSGAGALLRDATGKPVLPLGDWRSIYMFGWLIRETEQTLLRLFSEGLLSGTTHTCLGQEVCQISVVRALGDPDDVVFSNHRNHGHFLTYSGDFTGLIAEIMGREAGVCGGIGGSQHLAYRGFHSNGVQGGLTAIAVGRARAIQSAGGRGISVSIIGDGTLGQGLVYESLNLASVWDVPVLFVVENNRIAQTTPTSLTVSGDIEARAAAFGMQCWRCDDATPDFLERADAVVRAVRQTRKPGMLIVDTFRMGPHSKGDDLREPAELEAIRLRDPLERIGGLLPSEVRQEIREEARRAIEEATRRALESPPAKTPLASRTIFTYADNSTPRPPGMPSADGNVRHSLNHSLRRLLRESPEVVLLGEDLHDPYGGAFRVTAGLSDEFPGRVISTPISEAGVVGAGIGLAMAGYRPIVEIMFADFVTLAFDQIFNHAVKFPGMFRDVRVPLTIRTPAGGRRGYGPTHSQSPEGLLCGIPGLTVVFPSALHDCGELLERAVLDWPYPKVFMEHKLVYAASQGSDGFTIVEPSASDPAASLFPTLVCGSESPDVTLVAYGGMIELARAGFDELRTEELEARLVLPSLLSPFPTETLLRALSGSSCVVVVEEAPSGFGFGAELGAALQESGYRGRFARVGTPPVPIPAARSLESQIIPDRGRVLDAVMRLLLN
jgi:2-oxoisovalerate dehydrogenase E1 component